MFSAKFSNLVSYVGFGSAGYQNGTATTSQQGLFVANQSVANLKKTYRNGVEYLSFPYTSGLPNLPVFLGGVNEDGNPVLRTTRSMAFFSMGDALTPAQILMMYTAVQKFQTTLGRQV